MTRPDSSPTLPRARRKRQPEGGGYARGDRVRQQIIDAALMVFGRQGFDGASTREIAREAGVNTPALQYYFSSKDGLYAACADHVTQGGVQVIGAVVDQENATRDAQGCLPAPAASLDLALEALTDFMVEVTRRAADDGLFFFRDQRAGGAAARQFHDRVISPLLDLCVDALRQDRESLAPEPARLLALSLTGDIVFVFSNRRATLDAMGWDALTEGRIDLIRQTLARRRASLLADLDTHETPSSNGDRP